MKFVCQVCGYVHEGDAAPEKCPQCGAPAAKFTAQSGEMEWAAEHVDTSYSSKVKSSKRNSQF